MSSSSSASDESIKNYNTLDTSSDGYDDDYTELKSISTISTDYADSSDTDSSGSSNYYIRIDRDTYEPDPVYVVRRKYGRKSCRYDLKKLIKSDKPKCKQIVKSLVIDAVENDKSDAFERMLCKKYKLEILNDEGQTAVHLAFYHRSIELLFYTSLYYDQLDSEEKPDRTDYVDCNGLTHLHVASAYGPWSLVANYLENNDYVNARFRDSQRSFEAGFTPLHFAATANRRYYSSRAAELLIEHGADVNARDDQGRTPLHLISRSFTENQFDEEIIKVMKILIENKSDINAQDKNGNTPLLTIFTTTNDEFYSDPSRYYSKYSEYYTTVRYDNVFFEEVEQKLKLLLKHNADVTVKNKDGNTLLHQVIQSLKFLRCTYLENPDYAFNDSKHVEMLKLIFASEQKINIEAKNNNGETPLQVAVSYLSFDIVQLLLEYNADINNIKIRSDKDNFFKHINIALTLKPVQKLIDILELLYSKDCVLNLEENVTILKFLTHSNGNCRCMDINFFKSHFDILHLMSLDLPQHLHEILDKFYHILVKYDERYGDDDDDDDYDFHNLMNDGKMLEKIQKYYFYLLAGKIYIKYPSAARILQSALERYRTIREFDLQSRPDQKALTEIEKDLQSLKSISLINDVKLLDVLKKNPDETAKYFIKSNFDEECISSLALYKDIVKGHATKSLIKYFVQKFACVHLKMLNENLLTDVCCLHVTQYLSVNDVFNVCLALNM